MTSPLASLLPQGIIQFTDANGAPLSGGSVTFYQPNTTTLATIWADPLEAVQLQNPLPLDSAGRPQSGSSEVEIYGSGQYSMLVKDAYGNTIYGPVLTQDPLSLAEGLLPSFNNLTPSVASLGALRALATGASLVLVQGFAFPGDGGGGTYILGPTGVDNNCTIIVSANGTYYLETFGKAISILQLGGNGNGTTDNTFIFPLLPEIFPAGGTLILPPNEHFYIAASVTVPTGVTIQGPVEYIGQLSPSHASDTPLTWPVFVNILLASTATISMEASATLTGCLVYRYGMTFPTTSSSAFAGTAFTVLGDNVMFRNSLIMGFAYAINSNGFDRLMVEDMCFDNNNNIAVTNSNDTLKILRCHAWPFSADSPTQTGLTRTGSNISITSSTDAAMLTDCFSYGYGSGFAFADAQAVTCVNCDADGPSNTAGNGFLVEGSGANSRAQLIGCQAYSQLNGIVFGNTGGAELLVADCTVAGCGGALVINTGAVGIIRLHGSNLNSSSNGVIILSPNVSLDIDDNAITGITTTPISATIQTNNINVGTNNRFGNIGDTTEGLAVTNTNILAYTLTPSGSVLALPVVGNVFSIAGGQTFGTLSGLWAGRVVTLVFQGPTSILNSTGSPTAMALSGAATYNALVNNTLTLVHTGLQWYELARG